MEMTQRIETIEQTSWPQILLDQIARMEGLIMISGSRQADPLNVVKAIRRQHPDKKIIITDDLSAKKRNPELDNADIIIYHGRCEKEAMLAILDICEEGRLVVQILMAPSVVCGIHKVMTALSGSEETHLLWRYVDQLSIMINQMQINGIHDVAITAHEMILGTPQIKNLLLAKKISELEQGLKEGQEDRGMVSFNQVLLKLLIRRKIDLKVAFLKTRDPEHLDQLLKKVGV